MVRRLGLQQPFRTPGDQPGFRSPGRSALPGLAAAADPPGKVRTRPAPRCRRASGSRHRRDGSRRGRRGRGGPPARSAHAASAPPARRVRQAGCPRPGRDRPAPAPARAAARGSDPAAAGRSGPPGRQGNACAGCRPGSSGRGASACRGQADDVVDAGRDHHQVRGRAVVRGQHLVEDPGACPGPAQRPPRHRPAESQREVPGGSATRAESLSVAPTPAMMESPMPNRRRASAPEPGCRAGQVPLVGPGAAGNRGARARTAIACGRHSAMRPQKASPRIGRRPLPCAIVVPGIPLQVHHPGRWRGRRQPPDRTPLAIQLPRVRRVSPTGDPSPPACPLATSASSPRPGGSSRSSSGPDGTMPLGLMVSWLR